MSWWQSVPTVVCAAALVFLPGYVILRSWALTGLVAVGAAAPVSIGVLSVTAVLGAKAGLPWNVSLVVVPAGVLALIGLILRVVAPGALGLRGRARRPLRSRWTLLVHLGALLVPAVLLTRGLTRMIASPENISQTYDNIFHLNAIRYILQTESGSSLTVGGVTSDSADPSLYPAAWHDLVSLVVQTSGASIPVAVNAVTLVVGALVWPISAIFLTTRATGTRPVPVLFAGALAAVFGAFPYLMVDFGVLYPFFLSLALLPAALAVVTIVVGVGDRTDTPRWVLASWFVLAVAPGLALAHPSTLMALLVFAVPVLVTVVVRYGRHRPAGAAATARYWSLVLLLIGYLAAVAVLWTRIRPSEAASAWRPVQTLPQAIGQVLAAGFSEQGPTWIVLALTLAAAGLVMRGRLNGWVLGGYLIAAGLFLTVSALPVSESRSFLTGVWYNDTRRLAGQLPWVILVLSAIAATWLFLRALDSASTRYPALARFVRAHAATPPVAALAFVAAVALGVVGQFSSVNYQVAEGKDNYRVDDQAPVLSTRERTLLDRLDREVPPDATIIGNPWTGTSLAYAFAGRQTLTPHVGGSPNPDASYLMENLDDLGTDPRVCSTIHALNSYYVLDFAGRQVHDRDMHYDGLESLFLNPGLTVVDRQGPGVTLYRVTGCGPRR